jgi:hypothetical protein
VGTFSPTVGAFAHIDTIRRLRGLEGPLVMATFEIEASGQFAGAVRVLVRGEMVATIPAANETAWRRFLHDLGGSGDGVGRARR